MVHQLTYHKKTEVKKLKKLLTVLLCVAIFGLSATMVSAKHGKDDPSGDDRGGHGKYDRKKYRALVTR
jgi:hypothetical protein